VSQTRRPIEIFQPPNVLRQKVGTATAAIDLSALKRAEEALGKLKSEFAEWIETEMERLVECRDAFAATKSSDARDALFRASLDLKGQALTFEYPIVERIATSLCTLMEGTDSLKELGLVSAHVDAIRIAVRDKVKDAGDGVAAALISELESRVRETLATAGP